jgi:1-deoxy-D-xylulose-5-phosphate synthase
MLDRAGLTGPDGPTHHGAFDLGYLRLFPNIAVLAPGDEHDLQAMLAWALEQPGPVAIRYPKTAVARHDGPRAPIERGRSEVLVDGQDGLVVACGTLVGEALAAAVELRREGIEIAVVNARFVKPLDTGLLTERAETVPWVLTLEENALPTGFGGAVLEALADASAYGEHRPLPPVARLGLPDRFVEHGERADLLADLGLDAAGIAAACRRLAGRAQEVAAHAASLR